MSIEYKIGVDARVPVRLLTSANVGVSGITYSSVTAAIVKADGTTAVVTPADSSHWIEATTGAFALTGTYVLVIPAANVNVTGVFIYGVTVSGANPFVNYVKIVANEEVDTYTIAETINTDTTATALQAAIWDVAIAGHETAGSTGAALNAAGSAQWVFTGGGTLVDPTIVSILAPTRNQVTVTFSHPMLMDASTHGCLNLTNYSVTGLTLSNPVSINSNTVSLTTSTQTPGNPYTMYVTNVVDVNGNPITPP